MSESLREQLLKAGLAGSGKSPVRAPAERGRREERTGTRPQQARRQKGKDGEIDLARAYSLRARNDREEREREQRAAEQRSHEKKERRRRLAELLGGKALNRPEADIARHFPHRDRICRIHVDAAQLGRLNAGDLGVVQLAGRYLLVDREVALAAQAIEPEALVLLCEPGAAEDDGVPADLVW